MTVALVAVACVLMPQTAMAANGTTTIHPGDQLSVQVYGDTSLTQTVTVLNDGTIAYPLIGQVPVAGKTPEQAAALLTDRLLKYVRHPIVNVAISQLGQPNIMVLGDVKNPGKYQLRSDAHLSDAIAAAGGLNTDIDGPYPDARISQPGGTVSQTSLQKLLREGQSNLDQPLSEGDVVYVPGPVTFYVNVSGAVDHPGPIQVNQGDGLAVAIAKAGNSANSGADLNHVHLIRNVDGKQTTQEINLYQSLQSNDQSANVALVKGDTVYVPQARKGAPAGTFMSGILYILSRFIP